VILSKRWKVGDNVVIVATVEFLVVIAEAVAVVVVGAERSGAEWE